MTVLMARQSTPTVSVCVPVFNAERYVAAALDSVLAQSWPGIEIVAINDGSTDGSRAVLAGYEHRVKVVDQKNCGAAAARNAALSHTSGSHVLFLDADDLLHPDHVAALVVAYARGTAGSIAFSRWARFFDSLTDAVYLDQPTESDMSGVDWLLTDWADTLPMTQCGMFLLPRSLLDQTGGWDERLSLIDDFEFFTRVISACDGMVFATDACLYYRSGVGDSLSRQKSRKAIESQFLSLMLGTGHLLASEDTPCTRLACANMLQQFEYEHYPAHSDLRAQIRARVADLGGADILPIGPPKFHQARKFVGWRLARLLQRAFGPRNPLNQTGIR